ncbi:MAG: extracellular solute-binding protein [Oscillospiraceae bacterium]
MKAKKILSGSLALLITAGTMLSLGGCSDSSDSTASTTDTKEKVTLEVLTQRTDLDQNGTLNKLADSFEQANNCEVKFVSYTNYADDVSTRMSTDDYGDVLAIPDSVQLKDLSNFFVPLDTYESAKEKWQCADAKMYDNQVYGYPTALNLAGGVLYNKKIFADAGITALPKTPDEFIADLNLIATNCTGVIPLYTNFADSWTLAQWQGLVDSASGDPNYETNILKNKTELFAQGGAYYTVYKMMYDIFSDSKLHEEDPTSTEWEGSKTAFAQGKIGTLILGSWSVSQFRTAFEIAGTDPADVGYMPMPTTVNGVQYAQISADYCLGVSKHSANPELAKKFVAWYCGESELAQSESAICALKGSALPDFMNGVTTFINETPPDDLVGMFNKVDTASEVGTWNTDTANFKVKLAEAAFAGKGESEFNTIIADMNEKWDAARKDVLGS